MPLPALQPEIWLLIIRHLKRVVPPTRAICSWRDLHQHDLATMMRVNSMFNELTISILYDSVLIDDFNLLLHGCDSTLELPTTDGLPAPMPLPERISKPKEELLKSIRSLHLVHHSQSSVPSYASLLKHDSWHLLGDAGRSDQYWFSPLCYGDGISKSDLQYISDEAAVWLRGCGRVNQAYDNGHHLFPQLERISLASRGASLWEQRYEKFGDWGVEGEFSDEDIESKMMYDELTFSIAQLVVNTSARFVCQHFWSSPLRFPRTPSIAQPSSRKLIFTQHLGYPRDIPGDNWEEMVYDSSMIFGATNRYLINWPEDWHPIIDAAAGVLYWLRDMVVGVGLCRDYAPEEYQIDGQPASIEQLAKSTDIELYGGLVASVPQYGGMATDEQKQELDRIRPKAMRYLWDLWKGKISCFAYEAQPRCEACGMREVIDLELLESSTAAPAQVSLSSEAAFQVQSLI